VPIFNAITEVNPTYKHTVGTIIFDFVGRIAGYELAPKITGMMIDIPVGDIRHYVLDYDLFSRQVNNAKGMLEKMRSQSGP
jgi:hypothetical protein